MLKRFFPTALLLLLPALMVSAFGQSVMPLDRPALQSRLAEHGVLTSIRSAAGRWVAVGERGHVVYSDDRGATWLQGKTPASVTLTAAGFSSDGKHGWAVGHGLLILATSDGGASWVHRFDGRDLPKLLATASAHAETGAAAPLAVKTKRLAEEGADKPLFDILAVDDTQLLAVGAYGVLLRSADAGASWSSALDAVAPGEDRHIYAVRRIGAQVWLVGERGLVYRSLDQGRSFEALPVPTKATLFSISGQGEQLVIAGLRGNVLRSTDGGRNWQPVVMTTKNSLVDVAVGDPPAGFLIADDSGAVWRLDAESGQVGAAGSVRFPIASIMTLKDGTVLAAGLLGVARVESKPLATKSNKE